MSRGARKFRRRSIQRRGHGQLQGRPVHPASGRGREAARERQHARSTRASGPTSASATARRRPRRCSRTRGSSATCAMRSRRSATRPSALTEAPKRQAPQEPRLGRKLMIVRRRRASRWPPARSSARRCWTRCSAPRRSSSTRRRRAPPATPPSHRSEPLSRARVDSATPVEAPPRAPPAR